MNVSIQILCLLISFIYGMFIYISYNSIKKYNIFINLLYVYIIVITYIIIIYKINKGIFHIYFYLLIILGYLFMSRYVKKMLNILKRILCHFKR